MIVRFESSGTSFVGAGRYYLHDKAADRSLPKHLKPSTDERVWFTDTRNCLSMKPEEALIEMWRTADDQALLKAQAGVRASGRRCDEPVKTMSLAWHKDDAPSPEHMMATADSFLKHMGWTEHQAVLIGHSDTEHRHVHIILNRVHPEHGRTLNDFRDQVRAQQWAHAYEKEHGKIWCENREPNAELRRERAEDHAKVRAGEMTPEHRAAAEVARKTPANQHLPHNVILMARPQEKLFKSEEQRREEADKLERDLLKAEQRAEREAWFKNGAKLFKATRHAVYDEVRAEFRPEWRSLYKEHAAARKEAEAASKSGISRAHHYARNGQWAEARAAYKDRHHIVNAVNTTFTARLKDLKDQQKTTLKDRQDAAITALREARDPAYKLLLARQYAERAALRAEQARPGHQSERPTTSAQDYLDQVRAAAAANENKDPSATPPQAANTNTGPTPPEADAKRANGAPEPETAHPAQPRGSSVAGMEARSHHSADPDDPRAHPFKLVDPSVLSRSGHTLDAFASVLASTPRNNHSDVALVGLALHQEFKGSEAAKDLYSQWAAGNSAWANGETEMVWAGIKSDSPNITGLPMVIAIARAYGANTDLLAPIMEPKEEKAPREHHADPHDVTSEPEAAESFKQAPDLAAGAIGALAGYIADQIGEALAPTPPEVRARRALEEARREAERPIIDPAETRRQTRSIETAIRAAEAEREEQRSRDYWTERNRTKDKERDR